MSSVPEQLSDAAKMHCESQLFVMSALTDTALGTMEKLVELNLNAMKATLDEATAAATQILHAKDPQTFFASPSAQNQVDKAITYGRQLSSIIAGAQAEFAKIAEEKITDANRKVSALVAEAGKNAPAGTENAVAMLKTTLDNANASYEQFSKATKQVVGAVEGNLNNAANQFQQAAEKTRTRARK